MSPPTTDGPLMEGHAHRLLVDRLCREIRILIRREPGGLYVFLGIPLDHPFIGCPLDLIPILSMADGPTEITPHLAGFLHIDTGMDGITLINTKATP